MALVPVMAAVLTVSCGQEVRCEVSETDLESVGQTCPLFGVSTPGGPDAIGELRAVTAAVERAPAV